MKDRKELKEYFVRLNVKGIFFITEGKTEKEAVLSFFEKYEKHSSLFSEIQVFQRYFQNGELFNRSVNND